MRTCPSCGGIVGRDCFNPIECAMIGHAQEQQRMRVMQDLIDSNNRLIKLQERANEVGLEEAINYSMQTVPVLQLEYDRLKEAKDLLEKVYGHAEFEDKVLEQRIKEFIKQEIG